MEELGSFTMLINQILIALVELSHSAKSSKGKSIRDNLLETRERKTPSYAGIMKVALVTKFSACMLMGSDAMPAAKCDQRVIYLWHKEDTLDEVVCGTR
eukprot:7220000-Ditylum_brightwellii.AAC.1